MSVTVRRALRGDLAGAARLAALLVREHHAFDPERFVLLDDAEAGYRRHFERELRHPKAVLEVAVRDADGAVVGYGYGRMAPLDFYALLGPCGWLHDVYVDESARGGGVGARLVDAVAARLEALGAPRIVLTTAARNEAAQRLFERIGFRRTMIEMTREARRNDARSRDP